MSRDEKRIAREKREITAAISRGERQLRKLESQAEHAAAVRQAREDKIRRRLDRQHKKLAELNAA